MPKKSRIQRLGMWLSTMFRSGGAFFFPPNLKNAFVNVTKNWKEYICFYLAALAMGTGFWTIALCTESNIREARERVEANYDYHVEVVVPHQQAYVDLANTLDYELERENEYLADFYWAYDEKPLSDGSYVVRLSLTAPRGLEASFIWINAKILDEHVHGDIRFSPLYSFEDDFKRPYTAQLWLVSALWFAFSVLMLVLLFLIRLDHFRFIYGIYMTFGADFPRLMGAAGGELAVISLLCFLPAAAVGFGLTALLYIPAGVGLTVTLRACLIALGGVLLASFVAVWFPMRRLSKQAPIRHLAAGDNTALVSSPRRSFYLFGGGFPGRYELYTMWRMRKYYARLVISAVLFASVFVSGLYVSDLVRQHNRVEASEYILSYGDDAGEDPAPPDTDDASPAPAGGIAEEDAPLLWEDPDLFLSDIEAIPGVSHVTWSASVSGGYSASHIILRPGQVKTSGKTVVRSEERASAGFKWAMNQYDYTAVDELWIDNMIKNNLCTFEGDPYEVLTKDKHIIISEDIFNKTVCSFHPGDEIIVAVCEEVRFLEPMLDPQEMLRGQIRENRFRYETYTVAAVMRGIASEDAITFGVTVKDYIDLTGDHPVRDRLSVYMERGTDMDTVRAAESAIRAALSFTPGWSVTPTGNFFDAEVRALKNDEAVVLTLSVCLLCISPMIWYFSQIMFYRKRRREFALLSALGAKDADFARIHRMAGGLLSAAAFLVTILLTLLINAAIHTTLNNIIPRFFDVQNTYYRFSLSLPALIACVAASVLCGFLSSEIPYRLFVRRDRATDVDEL